MVDYAESQLELVVALIRSVAALKQGRTRIILLARNAAAWWGRLKRSDALTQEMLHTGTVTETRAEAMPIPADRREEALTGAMAAYVERLGAQNPRVRPDVSACRSAIELQMAALAAVTEADQRDLVAAVLERERRFWDQLATPHLPARLLEELTAAVYQVDGIDTREYAEAMFSGHGAFRDVPAHDLSELFELSRSLYPGEQFLNPIQPDLIGERLLEDQDRW